MACKVDSLPIVQLLLLNNAEQSITCKGAKNRTPKEVTKNQRIVYLIEKYEKRFGASETTSTRDEQLEMSFEEEEKGEGSLSDRQQSGQGALE
jgi:hypothetical protein